MASTTPPPLPREFLEAPRNAENGPDLSIVLEQVRALIVQETIAIQWENEAPDRKITVAA